MEQIDIVDLHVGMITHETRTKTYYTKAFGKARYHTTVNKLKEPILSMQIKLRVHSKLNVGSSYMDDYHMIYVCTGCTDGFSFLHNQSMQVDRFGMPTELIEISQPYSLANMRRKK